MRIPARAPSRPQASIRFALSPTESPQPNLTDVTDADLQAQFDLAIAIRDATARANSAILQIRSIRQQLADRAPDAETKKLAAAMESKLDEIEQDLYQTRNRSPRDTLNYPIKLNNQLAVLQSFVDMGEARPTDQDYAVFEELKLHLAQILGRFDQVLSNDLPQFNQWMESHQLPPVKPK